MFDFVAAICKVVASSVAEKTGAIMLSFFGPGGEGEENGEKASSQPEFGMLGIIARPLPPSTVDGRSAYLETIAVRTGNKLVPIAYRDLRLNAFYPKIAEGTVALVGYGGGFVRSGADGVVAMATTEPADSGGRPVFYQVRPDGFVWESPYVRARMDAKGFHVRDHGGARLDLGTLGMPSPLDALATYATLTAATVNLNGTLVNLGPTTPAPGVTRDVVALATPILSFAAATVAVIDACMPAITAAAALIPDPTFATAIVPLMNALHAAATAVASSGASKSVSAV